jgi:hypothetical protein
LKFQVPGLWEAYWAKSFWWLFLGFVTIARRQGVFEEYFFISEKIQ